MNHTKDLSIIILSYRARDWVEKNLLELRKALAYLQDRGKTAEVILVDSSESCDGVCQLAAEEFLDLQIKVIPLHQNLGFPKGNNVGLELAEGRYILLLNPDLLVSEDTLEKTLTAMETNPKYGVLTARVNLVATGKLDPATHRGFPTPWNSFTYYSGLEKLFPHHRWFSGYHMGWCDLEVEHEIDACSGTFMLLRRVALKDIGGKFSEDYFMYAEDIDTCYRIKNLGWKVVYYPYTTCKHFKGVTSGIAQGTKLITPVSKETRQRSAAAFWDDNLKFYLKHYEKKYPIWVNWGVKFAMQLKKQLALRKLQV